MKSTIIKGKEYRKYDSLLEAIEAEETLSQQHTDAVYTYSLTPCKTDEERRALWAKCDEIAHLWIGANYGIIALGGKLPDRDAEISVREFNGFPPKEEM